MDKASVIGLLERIPQRVTRAVSGTPFTEQQAARSAHPDRVAHVAQFLHWVSPLYPITRDDQRILGLLAVQPRPDVDEDDGAEPPEALDPPGMEFATLSGTLQTGGSP